MGEHKVGHRFGRVRVGLGLSISGMRFEQVRGFSDRDEVCVFKMFGSNLSPPGSVRSRFDGVC